MTNTIEQKFEKATRSKFRFPFKGLISVEDLWDLSVQNLDSVFKVLNAEKKQVEEESLLNTKTKENQDLEIKIEIVKHIFDVKRSEADARLKEKENKETIQKLLEIKASKQDEALKNKTPEEIDAMIAELQSK